MNKTTYKGAADDDDDVAAFAFVDVESFVVESFDVSFNANSTNREYNSNSTFLLNK